VLTRQIWREQGGAVKPHAKNAVRVHLLKRTAAQLCEILDSFCGAADDFDPAKIRTSFMPVPAHLEDA
jgi:hypothetical protein